MSQRAPEPPTSREFVKQSTLYQEFLAEREEILRHKWLESERLGYDTAWIAEHHFATSYGIMPDCFAYMAYLAAKTSKINIGAAVRAAQRKHEDPVAAILAAEPGKLLYKGSLSPSISVSSE